MIRVWNGYLVRALNELASFTAACQSINAGRPVPARAKASVNGGTDHHRRPKKSLPRRREPFHIGEGCNGIHRLP